MPPPEVYTEGVGWRSLSTAVSDDAYGARNWSDPRAWVAPNGKVFIATIWGGTYFLLPSGTGALQRTALTPPLQAFTCCSCSMRRVCRRWRRSFSCAEGH